MSHYVKYHPANRLALELHFLYPLLILKMQTAMLWEALERTCGKKLRVASRSCDQLNHSQQQGGPLSHLGTKK